MIGPLLKLGMILRPADHRQWLDIKVYTRIRLYSGLSHQAIHDVSAGRLHGKTSARIRRQRLKAVDEP